MPRRIWLPAYYCHETSNAIATAASEIGAQVAYYGLTHELDPAVEYFEERLGSGDLVLVVDYFGWPPSQQVREWITTKRDVVWVEDRSQALWTMDPPWAPWCVYSARKLLGVPNGGMLLGTSETACVRSSGSAPDLAIALPELLRLEDRSEAHDNQSYAAYKERERRFDRDSGPMSRLTEALLRRIPIGPLAAARQTNYRYLLQRLPEYAAWPRDADDVAPFGLVIAVRDPKSLQRRLAEDRLFCARHWPEPVVDRATFPYEGELSDQLLTLPCDHRYAPETLARLADAIERFSPTSATVQANRK
jgi:hypothetical protein